MTARHSTNSQRLAPSRSSLARPAGLAGCTVGPDFRGAPAAAPDRRARSPFHRAPQDASSAQPSAAPLVDRARRLRSSTRSSRRRSPTAPTSRPRRRACAQSRAALKEQKSNALPKSGASASYINAELPKSALELGISNLYNLGFDATWEVDLFGGTRRAVEAAAAESVAVEADLADARVQLAAEVAQVYVDLRDQQRAGLARRTAELEAQILDLTEQRRAQGVASDLDVERIRTQVENTRASSFRSTSRSPNPWTSWPC